MVFMCDFTLQHQTRAQLDMRRPFEPQMTHFADNNPFFQNTKYLFESNIE